MAAPSQRRLDIEEVGDVTVARFVDKKILDENNIQIIGNQLFGLIEEDGRKKIVLDFTNVEYLSSAALGKLITMDKKVKAASGKLRLCNIRKDIYEVFAITRLNKVFDIRNTQDEAVAHVGLKLGGVTAWRRHFEEPCAGAAQKLGENGRRVDPRQA